PQRRDDWTRRQPREQPPSEPRARPSPWASSPPHLRCRRRLVLDRLSLHLVLGLGSREDALRLALAARVRLRLKPRRRAARRVSIFAATRRCGLPAPARLGYVLARIPCARDPPMFPTPKPELRPNTYAYESEPMVKATGFREYDARWLFGKEINLMGVQALGMGLGTLIHELGVRPEIVTGHDFRSYSASIKYALVPGLLAAGCKVHDIGLAVTPMAYFAQFALDVPCVAMVTASHNDNGWTGVKMGANRPLTFGPDEMTRLKEIVLGAR